MYLLVKLGNVLTRKPVVGRACIVPVCSIPHHRICVIITPVTVLGREARCVVTQWWHVVMVRVGDRHAHGTHAIHTSNSSLRAGAAITISPKAGDSCLPERRFA